MNYPYNPFDFLESDTDRYREEGMMYYDEDDDFYGNDPSIGELEDELEDDDGYADLSRDDLPDDDGESEDADWDD